MTISYFSIAIVSVGVMLCGASVAFCQDYPNKPIRIATSAAGGGPDTLSRLIAPSISGPLGQQVIVENRGSGFVVAEFVSKAPPDGYTLLAAGSSFWTRPLMQKSSYDPVKDFLPITLIERSVNVVAVHPSLPVRSVKELITLAKARPGELNYGSGPPGSSSHLAPELFKAMAGVNIAGVAYKGTNPALIALLGGEVQLIVSTGIGVAAHLKSGRMKGLAVTSAGPSALFPDLPTVAATVPGYESVDTSSIFVPAKTPQVIIRRLNQEIVRYLKTEEAKQKFFELGSEPLGGSPEELATAMKAEMGRLAKLVKDMGINFD